MKRKPQEHRVVEFTVYGEPAPQGSKRHVGNGRMIESSAKVKPRRQDVAQAGHNAMYAFITDGVNQAMALPPLDGPLMASIVFTLQRPLSAPKHRIWPDRKPDLSKLLRSTEDALKTAGVIADDARIVSFGELDKVYVGHPKALPMPGAKIKVETMT